VQRADLLQHDIESDAAAGHLTDRPRGREPRLEDQPADAARIVGDVDAPCLGRAPDRVEIEAATIVGDLDPDS